MSKTKIKNLLYLLNMFSLFPYFQVSHTTILPVQKNPQNQTDLYFLPCLLYKTSYQVLSHQKLKILCYLVPSVPTASAQNRDWCSILPFVSTPLLSIPSQTQPPPEESAWSTVPATYPASFPQCSRILIIHINGQAPVLSILRILNTFSF